MSMRDRLFSFIVGAAALGLMAAMPSPLTAQEDCPRGTLDKQYCDRDGDQIADLPIDPNRIHFPVKIPCPEPFRLLTHLHHEGSPIDSICETRIILHFCCRRKLASWLNPINDYRPQISASSVHRSRQSCRPGPYDNNLLHTIPTLVCNFRNKPPTEKIRCVRDKDNAARYRKRLCEFYNFFNRGVSIKNIAHTIFTQSSHALLDCFVLNRKSRLLLIDKITDIIAYS